MTGVTALHHEWVKDALNVDPTVYDMPDEDIEADLDKLDLSRASTSSVDLSALSRDFTDPVHAAAKRARTAMVDLEVIGSIAWKPEDAAGAAKIIAAAAPEMSREDRAILALDLRQIGIAAADVTSSLHSAQAAANTYLSAVKTLSAPLQKIKAPPPDDPEPALGDTAGQVKKAITDGTVQEHVWDVVNSVTQIVSVLSAIHMIAGMDLIKDALKQDDTEKKIAEITSQLDAHRDGINGLIDTVQGQAREDMANAAEDYLKRIDEIEVKLANTRGAVAAYGKDLATFATPSGRGKAPKPDPNLAKVIQTYKAVLATATASKMARDALNTATLGPGAYQEWVGKLVPLGKPITDDANTSGASLFRKGRSLVEYSETVKVTEALASGMEVVRDVYADAPTIDAWATAWGKAMAGSP